MKLLIEESVLRKALEAFGNYTNVCSSVNDHSTFTPQIKDDGGPARESIIALRSALDAADRGCEMSALKEMNARLAEERAECEEQARLNGMGAERESALLANVEMLERELAKANKLAADRLEQVNADRKAYLDLKQKIDSEGIKE